MIIKVKKKMFFVISDSQIDCKLQIYFPWNCFSWLVQEEPGSSYCSLRVLKLTNYKLFIIKFIEGEQKIHEPGFRLSQKLIPHDNHVVTKTKGKSVETPGADCRLSATDRLFRS